MIKVVRGISLLVFFLSSSSVLALETATHESINKFITENHISGFKLDSYLLNRLGFPKGIKEEFVLRKVWEWFGLGGVYEDLPPNRPYISSFIQPFPRAHIQQWNYYQALTNPNKYLRNDYLKDTFRGLGQLMHLVQDASVPSHVRDDGHPFGHSSKKYPV